MEVFLGPFHPALEEALVREVAAHKRDDALAPLLILLPSDTLRRRVKLLLARERGLSLLNVFVLTFYQLSLTLYEEAHGAPPTVQDDALFEEALRALLRSGEPGTSTFAGLEETVGGCGALWQSLRDLKDGTVEPDRVLEALEEGHFAAERRAKLESLLLLFRSFCSRLADWGFRDFTDVDLAAREAVDGSRFLAQFRRIFYYGFYDLTQVQLDLFHAVARTYPVTLFFPLVRHHPAWDFAQRFYERHVHGAARQATALSAPDWTAALFHASRAPLPSGAAPACRIYSAAGSRDEVLLTAKEILRLASDEGFGFEEVGVVARSLEPYGGWIRNIFREHSIPIACAPPEPALRFPAVKTALLLMNLPAGGYLRSQVVQLVSSPFFNARRFCPPGLVPRPDLWDALTRRLGIARGIEEWARLERHRGAGLTLRGEDEEGDRGALRVGAEQVRLLWEIVSALQTDLSALGRQGSWRGLAEAWRGLFEKYLDFDGSAEIGEGNVGRIRSLVFEALQALAALEPVQPRVPLADFIRAFERLLAGASLAPEEGDARGVWVLDAMAARGLSFRALFLLGLNEGIFPRTIREDAFLRDSDRRRLQSVLGYKVGEKLAGFDEEKLLFALLASGARERLYCLYARSDESGRALAPSWYLTELEKALGRDRASRIAIPRAIADKKRLEPFSRADLSPPEELALGLSLEGGDPEPLLSSCGLPASVYRRGVATLARLENVRSRLHALDGNTGSLPEFWNAFNERGVAPTALERYSQCPFRFFASHVIGLEPLDRPEEQAGIEPSSKGKLVHSILKDFFQELIDSGYFSRPRPTSEILPLLEAVARKTFRDFERENPVGYAAVWESVQEELLQLLKAEVTADLEGLTASGYRPIALEAELEGAFPPEWQDPLGGLRLRGKIDRVDLQREQKRLRVIDYKYRSGKNAGTTDTNPQLAAVRGDRLQLPLYILLARQLAAADAEIDAGFRFLAPLWAKTPPAACFSAKDLEGAIGASLRETLSFLLRGIREGLFFIQPGDHCALCDFAAICRKNHPPTRWRHRNDPITEAHRALRRKRIVRENEPNSAP